VDGPQHREKQCVTCDKVINRDVNAALNLKVGT
jgi:transposase